MLGHVLASWVLPADAVDGAAAIAFWDEVVVTHELLWAVQVVFGDSFFPGVFRQHLAQRYGIRVGKPAHVLVRETHLPHPRLVLDCRAHVRVARYEPALVQRMRPDVALCKCLNCNSQHSQSLEILLTRTAS